MVEFEAATLIVVAGAVVQPAAGAELYLRLSLLLLLLYYG